MLPVAASKAAVSLMLVPVVTFAHADECGVLSTVQHRSNMVA
jgi:hypothetical protein